MVSWRTETSILKVRRSIFTPFFRGWGFTVWVLFEPSSGIKANLKLSISLDSGNKGPFVTISLQLAEPSCPHIITYMANQSPAIPSSGILSTYFQQTALIYNTWDSRNSVPTVWDKHVYVYKLKEIRVYTVNKTVMFYYHYFTQIRKLSALVHEFSQTFHSMHHIFIDIVFKLSWLLAQTILSYSRKPWP